MEDDLPAAREFRMDPKYIRSGLYVAVSWILLGFVANWVNGVRVNPPLGSKFLPIGFWITSLAGLLPFRWRLRVDPRGISRRRLLRWDLWPWEEFAAGRLKLGYGDRCLTDPAKPWWGRTLSLEYLTDADSDQVWKWISLVWQPAETRIPEVLEFRAGDFRKRAFHFDHDGVQIGSGTRLQRFQWSDVALLEITRPRHDRPDFYQLKLELPAAQLHLRRHLQYGLENRNWSGAEPDAIANYLLHHAPEDRQVIIASKDDPITQRELHVRLAHARKQFREFKQMCWILCSLAIAIIAWAAFAGEWRIMVMLPIGCVVNGLLVYFGFREKRQSVQKLEAVRIRVAVPRQTLALPKPTPSAMPPG